MVLMRLIFEWDENKARQNRRKHKVSLEEAKTVFNDPLLITFPDEYHSATRNGLSASALPAEFSWSFTPSAGKAAVPPSYVLSAPEKQPHLSAKSMKSIKTKKVATDEMLPEYDFTGKKGVRGKYHRAYRQGHEVRIYNADGSMAVQYFSLQDGAVMLEPDVKRYFSDSESVNKALRALITLIPNKKPKPKTNSK